MEEQNDIQQDSLFSIVPGGVMRHLTLLRTRFR